MDFHDFHWFPWFYQVFIYFISIKSPSWYKDNVVRWGPSFLDLTPQWPPAQELTQANELGAKEPSVEYETPNVWHPEFHPKCGESGDSEISNRIWMFNDVCNVTIYIMSHSEQSVYPLFEIPFGAHSTKIAILFRYVGSKTMVFPKFFCSSSGARCPAHHNRASQLRASWLRTLQWFAFQ